MSEAWKPVVGFEGLYEVAPCGAIRNSRTLRWLSPSVKDDGYTSVKLFKDGRGYQKSVHRVVAEAYLPNPESKPQVNHKDLNKKNNDVSNLEWVTQEENLAHAIRNGTNKTRISKLKMNEKYQNIFFLAKCDECGARTKLFRDGDKAEEAWNRRYDQEDIPIEYFEAGGI